MSKWKSFKEKEKIMNTSRDKKNCRWNDIDMVKKRQFEERS